jgi:hypothetical protein
MVAVRVVPKSVRDLLMGPVMMSVRFDFVQVQILKFSYGRHVDLTSQFCVFRLHILFTFTPAYVLLQKVHLNLGSSPSGHPSEPHSLRSRFLAGHQPLGGSLLGS